MVGALQPRPRSSLAAPFGGEIESPRLSQVSHDGVRRGVVVQRRTSPLARRSSPPANTVSQILLTKRGEPFAHTKHRAPAALQRGRCGAPHTRRSRVVEGAPAPPATGPSQRTGPARSYGSGPCVRGLPG